MSVTLQAEEGKVQIGDLKVDGATFNGIYAGPVLRVRPGDLISIQLLNHLAQPTNLHFHGIRTSPLGYSDNVHISVAPGKGFTYHIRIPITQPPGLYWFHAHYHGLSEQQVERGLSGTIIVENPAQPLMTERLFVLKDMAFDAETGNDKIDDELHGLIQSVNGQLDTAELVRPHETQLWQFTNQSADRFFHIALRDHRFRIVAEDGERVIDERWVDTLDIPPAKRFEVMLEGGEPGRYELLSKGAMTGIGVNRRPDRVLGHLDVAGEPAAPAVLPALSPPPDLRQVPIDARQLVTFSETRTLKEKDQVFYINGRTFDANRVDVRASIGTVEEWTIRNDSDDMHVFHIHQIGFQVTEVNGQAVPFTGYVDTVRVPERGEVKLRLPFTDRLIIGRFMFHCHVLRHEDKGMMAQIEVYDPLATSMTARLSHLYLHVWWWVHGVPWSLCGLETT